MLLAQGQPDELVVFDARTGEAQRKHFLDATPGRYGIITSVFRDRTAIKRMFPTAGWEVWRFRPAEPTSTA